MSRQFKCTKCGAEASSKCPSQRTVFLEDQMAAVLSNVINFKAERLEEGPHEGAVKVEFDALLRLDEGDDPLREMILLLTQQTESIQRATCRHRWEIQYGECLFGCHKAD